MDPSKCTFIADDQGRAQAYNPEIMLARQLSAWQGWHCSAGVDNICINGDGKVFVAACRVGGEFGNVYVGGCQVREKWTVCTKQLCTCGSDMRLAKVKYQKDIDRLKNLNSKELNFALPMGESTMVGKIWDQEVEVNLNWDVGRRCNYSCSYCHPGISNTHEAHQTWEKLFFAVNEIERFFCRGRKGKWVFTGGEPTLNPDFLRLVKEISSRGHQIHTQSNGSRSPDYYAELLENSLIGFSLHLEFAKVDRFLKVLKKLIELKSTAEALKFQWVGVRIMTGPGRSAEALAIKRQITDLNGAARYLNQVVLAPLYDVETSSRLQIYPPGELGVIAEHS